MFFLSPFLPFSLSVSLSLFLPFFLFFLYLFILLGSSDWPGTSLADLAGIKRMATLQPLPLGAGVSHILSLGNQSLSLFLLFGLSPSEGEEAVLVLQEIPICRALLLLLPSISRTPTPKAIQGLF